MNRKDPPNRASTLSSTAIILGEKKNVDLPDLPSWQKTLISQIINSLKLNYVFPDEIKENELSAGMTSNFRKLFSTSDYATEDNVVNRYELCLMSDKGVLPEKDKLYIEGREGLLIYTVINPSGNIVTGKIRQEELGPEIEIKAPFNLDTLKPLQNNILNITSKRGHTLEFAEEFAKGVTKILGELIGDAHIYLSFDKNKIAAEEEHIKIHGKFSGDLALASPEVISEEERKKREAEFKENNCGFHGPRGIDKNRIPENVGYIGLDFMANAEIFPMVRKEAFQAMLSVEHKDAIIIDLRNNGGGAPAGVQYFLSFFFREPTLINTFRKLEKGAWQEKKSSTWPKEDLNPDPGGEFKDKRPPDLSEKPVYILINEQTISAGEELAYDMQQLKRATIIGMPSVGAAHPCGGKPLLDPGGDEAAFNKNFILYEPSATAINPYSDPGSPNWEDGPDKGVQPDIFVRNKDITYELALMSDEIVAPKKGKFYVRYENDALEYKVKKPDGEMVKGKIDKADLKDVLFPYKLDILQPFSLEKLSPCLPKIIDATSRETDALALAVSKIQVPKPTNIEKPTLKG